MGERELHSRIINHFGAGIIIAEIGNRLIKNRARLLKLIGLLRAIGLGKRAADGIIFGFHRIFCPMSVMMVARHR